ncbi:hypothetical protein MTO96_042874 [Rhipicephalus appendiculatus]
MHRDPSVVDASSVVADGVAASSVLWLKEPFTLPRRGGRRVSVCSGDGGRDCGVLARAELLCAESPLSRGDPCCPGLDVVETSLLSCENRDALEDLLRVLLTSLGVGDGEAAVAETSSGMSGILPRRGEKGVSASSGGVGAAGDVLVVGLVWLDRCSVNVELELCDDRRVIVRAALLAAAAWAGLPVGVAAGAVPVAHAVVDCCVVCRASRFLWVLM